MTVEIATDQITALPGYGGVLVDAMDSWEKMILKAAKSDHDGFVPGGLKGGAFRETLAPLVENSKGARVSVLVEGARVQSGAKGIVLDLSITSMNSENVSILDPMEGLGIQVKNDRGESLKTLPCVGERARSPFCRKRD